MDEEKKSVIQIRHPRAGDGEALVRLMNALDEETSFMMLEPGERTTTAGEQEQSIQAFLESTSQVMYVADAGSELVGFVAGLGRSANRNRHAMSCIIGVKQQASRQGLGTRLMQSLDTWARRHGFTRLELTVMAHNHRAKRLYLSMGFEIEGTI